MINKINITDYVKENNDILVDLRSPGKYSFGTLEGAVNIPFDDTDKLFSLPYDKRIVLFCQIGRFSSEIAELLSDIGYETVDLEGGYIRYLSEQII